MRPTPGPGARPNYYDRNAITRSGYAQPTSGSAIRAVTEDWRYTAPAGKLAYVEYLFCLVKNRLNVALNGTARSWISFGADQILEQEIFTGEAIVNRNFSVGGSGLLNAGDYITGNSQSGNSAAGTDVRHHTAYKLTEFDA